ncbi:MAG: PQQ-binding-like beta-propeller repeat protein [Planctomycetes bacterium]|nr:PQQ-binding-like beta-propeller repeat protein [Planctomycetota bacterium]MCB9885844.1 PQQ-binding-like beta-propeller repeat protein [Planctomycetota bacterium]
MRCRLLVISLLATVLATVVPAQETAKEPAPAPKPGERLHDLLRQIGKLDAAAWAERKAALEQQAKAADKQAADLRAQAARLQQQAKAADEAAAAVRAEIVRLEQLQKLLGAPPAEPAPAKPAAKPAAPAKAEAKTDDKAKEKTEPKTEPKVEKQAKDMAPPAAAPAAMVADAAASEPLVFWRGRVERLLQDQCSSCHEPGEKKGGLDVTTFAAIRAGGGSGRTLVPGDPEHSRLWLMVSQQERPFMPKGDDPLPADELQLLRTWIEQGACEDEASARAFVRAQAAANKAEPQAAPMAAAPAVLPENLPPLPLHTGVRPAAVKSLARSPVADLIAMPGLQQVLLFDAQFEPFGALPCPQPAIECVNFTADGSQLVVGCGEPGRTGIALVYDVRTGRQLGAFGAERDVPLAVAAHAGRGLVALGGAGKRARVLRQRDGEELFAGAHDDYVLSLQFSPDGKLLAAGDRAGAIQLWEVDGGRLGSTLPCSAGAVNGLAFASGGRLLAAACADGSVRGFDILAGKELWKRNAHRGEATAVAFGPADTLASAGQDGCLDVLTSAGKPVATSKALGEWLYSVAFGASGEVVFGGDWLGRVHRFDSKSKQVSTASPLAAGQ